jgi:hypothetical protein
MRITHDEWRIAWLAWAEEANKIVPSEQRKLNEYRENNPNAPIKQWVKQVKQTANKIGLTLN